MARLKSISQAPVFSLFSETMNGLYTVRAYKMQEQFTRDIEAKLNANQRSYIFGFTTGRWLSVRMDFISGLIVMTIAAIAIFGRSTVSAGLVGIALSYSLLSSGAVSRLV
jgi:ABC-type bacteriocin/lantibiotic exporter with double-glycine peptidase domain